MLAPEGFRYIAPVVISAVVVQFYVPLLAIPLWLVALFLMYLFRDPQYNLASVPLALVCPVSSTVSKISKEFNPYLECDAIRIDFEMSLTDCYNLLSVTEGKIKNFWLNHPDKGNTQKLRTVWVQTDENDDVVMEVHASRTGQLMCYQAAGERVGQGKKCGFLPFGAIVSVYLPAGCVVELNKGDKVSAGKDIITHWPRS